MPRVPMLQEADDVKAVAGILIAKYHPHLAEAKILYVFTDQKRHKCDRVTVGSASIMNAFQRFLSSAMQSVESGAEVLVMVDIQEWTLMDEAQQRRLVDHELEHVKLFVKAGLKWRRLASDESPEDFLEARLGIVGHDIEEFAAIFERHGWANGEQETRVKEVALGQMPMPEMKLALSRN